MACELALWPSWRHSYPPCVVLGTLTSALFLQALLHLYHNTEFTYVADSLFSNVLVQHPLIWRPSPWLSLQGVHFLPGVIIFFSGTLISLVISVRIGTLVYHCGPRLNAEGRIKKESIIAWLSHTFPIFLLLSPLHRWEGWDSFPRSPSSSVVGLGLKARRPLFNQTRLLPLVMGTKSNLRWSEEVVLSKVGSKVRVWTGKPEERNGFFFPLLASLNWAAIKKNAFSAVLTCSHSFTFVM